MKYYISETKADFAISRIHKRLSDFKGTEGSEYHVRTKSELRRFDSIPIYNFKNGKLRRCAQKSYAVIGIF